MSQLSATQEISRVPEVILLSAADSHTDQSALLAMKEFNLRASSMTILHEMGLTEGSGVEWRVAPELRAAAIDFGMEQRPSFWKSAHEHYFRVSAGEVRPERPAYMNWGLGSAYHGVELDKAVGLANYRSIAHVESLALTLSSLRLSEEQTARGLIDKDDPALIFLRGMAHYRMDDLGQAIPLLRRIANLDEPSKEVAVAKHLVGRFDCLRSNKGSSTKGPQSMLRESHKSAAKRSDKPHLAQVKHTMAVCMLHTSQTGLANPAIRQLQQSLSLTRELGDVWGEAMVLHTLGQALTGLKGRHEEAIEALKRSLEIGEDLGYMDHVDKVQDSLRRVSGGHDQPRAGSRGDALTPPRTRSRRGGRRKRRQ